MNIELAQKLELKIYGFSVNVYSFVKTLIEKKISDKNTKALLNEANKLYSSYLDILEAIDKGNNSPDKSECIQISGECITLFQNIELTGAILNEKVDLAIEANEILRKLKEI
jgi:hypothetical protein